MEDNVVQQTNVTFEFNVKRAEESFDVRNAAANLLREIFQIDRSLKVKSKIDNMTWDRTMTSQLTMHFTHTLLQKKLIRSMQIRRHLYC